MNIVFLIIIAVNLIMCFVVWIGAWNYKLAFYKMGVIVHRRKFKINKNYLINDIGKELEKDYMLLKILNENKALFYSQTKSAIESILTYKMVPEIIFGEINICNDNVTIDFKIPFFIIPLFLTFIAYEIYTKINDISFVIPIFIFIGIFFGIASIFQILKIINMKIDIEYYINNGK
jgi:hypothetical protein